MNKNRIYQSGKINRFNVRLQWGIAILVFIQSLLNYDLTYALKLCMYLLPVLLAMTTLYFLKLPEFIKSFLIGSGAAVLGLVISIGFGGEFKYFLTYYIALIMMGLYFNTRLILLYAVLLDTVLILLYLIKPLWILPGDHGNEFISMIFLFNIAIGVFAVMAKWGNEYILSAEEKGLESAKLVLDLEKILSNSRESASALDQGIVHLNDNMETISEISNAINAATQEIAAGVQEEASSIQKVLESAIVVGKNLSEIKAFSSKNADESQKAAVLVKEGLSGMRKVSSQMEDISTVVQEASQDMKHLDKNIDDINDILKSLIEISSKTNLLALNAAIEAARAGDAGRGFSVVADEVRKLAEVSKSNVDRASDIIKNITDTKNKTLYGVVQGNDSAQEGLVLITDVVKEFQKTLDAFREITKLTKEEYKNIEVIHEKFQSIEEQIGNIASISEEHAASIEEIQATIDEENNQISSVNESVKKLKTISEKLSEV